MGSRHFFKTEVQLRPVEESSFRTVTQMPKYVFMGLVLTAAGLLLLALTFGTVPPPQTQTHTHTHTHTHLVRTQN